MNPLAIAAIGSIIRWGLAFGAGYIVKAGIWSASDAEKYVAAAAIAIITLGWSLWQKYKSRLKFIAALELPAGASEAAAVKKADTVSVKAQAFQGPIVGLLLAASVVGAVGCAAHTPRDKTQVGALAVGRLAVDLSKAERLVFDSHVPGYDAAARTPVDAGIKKLLYAARAYERAAAGWPAGTPAPTSVMVASQAVLRALDDLTHVLPAIAAIRDPLTQGINGIRLALASVPAGAGLPPPGVLAIFALAQLIAKLVTSGKTTIDKVKAFLAQEGATPEQLAAIDAELTDEIAQRERGAGSTV